ncbi:Ig-like domain-containing protein [Alteromonas halophila]|uniref:Cadherin-like domain-containing protein n=1 Tax=Alteromonas halophila TaxID=516698 RepID=A0A918N1F0_9ALTE|nr:Ig-like domain-containing protein [Alteromonas halophila]GGW93444.1 hypothetical protein GCM10007391_29770 [Alteromonas halophila]
MNHSIKLLLVAGLAGSLSGCFDSDDDDNDNQDGMQNAAPTATDASFTTEADTAFTEMLDASDPDGDTLTYALEEEPTMGSVEVMDSGEFTYTPAAQVTGMDSFVFSVSDGTNAAVTATVSITIEDQQVSLTSYTREAFMQDATDTPLPVNGRTFTDDADDGAFDDLLMDQ